MTNSELVVKVSEKTEVSKKETKVILDALNEVIKEAVLNGEEVTLGSLGKFVVKDVDARTCRNPQTGESIEVPAHKTPKFKISSTLKKLFK